MKKLTIKEIAKMAGVSVTAVSFVLNEKPGVSEDTRKKVQAIIEETGFKPSLNSKRLVLNKSFNISLIVNPYSSPFEDLFYFEIMNGILNQSSKHGYNIVINKIRRGELPDSVYSGDADGMIFMQDITPAMKKKAIASGIPFVVVDTHDADPSLISVSADYTRAAYMATTHLIENGHKNIALLASNIIPDFYKQTLQGFANALLENSIAVLPEFIEQTAYNEESAYFAAKEILSRENPPTAIVCAMDSFAIGAIKCIKEMNLSVPDDVS
ncbi:MAG: LacI family DNA-binding transcriptional regulator, partial [Clostridia bacterium]|nr:LacI family DNA-binding transcriptional regulator [Clostridia bacterium]